MASKNMTITNQVVKEGPIHKKSNLLKTMETKIPCTEPRNFVRVQERGRPEKRPYS